MKCCITEYTVHQGINHVRVKGRGKHFVHLAAKVDPAVSVSVYQVWAGITIAADGTHMNDKRAITRAVDSETPILASGAVGSQSSVVFW
jgi:hypothetical protein